MDSILAELKVIMPIPTAWSAQFFEDRGDGYESVLGLALEHAHDEYDKKEADLTPERMRLLEQLVLLRVIDRLWVFHLTALEELRQGIGLQGYGQKDPLVEFKREAFDMFSQLNEHIRQNTVRQIYHVTLTTTAPRPPQPPAAGSPSPSNGGPSATPGGNGASAAPANDAKARKKARQQQRVAAAGSASTATTQAPARPLPTARAGRNDPCPCGSGKKYKKCHGAGGVAGIS
jgi:preprotein translocase subunit SecA